MNKKFFSLLVCSALAANAQVFMTADIKTVASDLGSANGSSTQTRLFTDSGFTTAAAIGYNLWFVADTARNGVPTSGVLEGSILGSDDRLVYSARLDGDNPGSIAGRFRALGVTIDSSVATGGVTTSDILASHIYVYLWNSSSASFTPAAGNQFGVFNTGTFTVPDIGNAFWAIDGNINATAFTVSAVPEPGEYAAMAGGALVAFTFWRRRQQARTV
jgi:hypothetical protein